MRDAKSTYVSNEVYKREEWETGGREGGREGGKERKQEKSDERAEIEMVHMLTIIYIVH